MTELPWNKHVLALPIGRKGVLQPLAPLGETSERLEEASEPKDRETPTDSLGQVISHASPFHPFANLSLDPILNVFSEGPSHDLPCAR